MIDIRAQLTNLSLNVMCRMLVGNLSEQMHDIKDMVHEALRIMGYTAIQDYLPFLGYWFDPNGVIKGMHKVSIHTPLLLPWPDGTLQLKNKQLVA